MTKPRNIGIIHITKAKGNRKEDKSMKNKLFSRKSKGYTQKAILFCTALSLTVLFIFTFGISAFAENVFRVENCNKCEAYSQKLGEEINQFIELDKEPEKKISDMVTDAVNVYRKSLLDLQTHPDVEKRSLENEIILEYVKGCTAGRVAWVYYYNIYTFTSQSSIDKITAKYNEYKSRIANAEAHTVLSAECDVMLNDLNRLIFTESMQNLALPSDSLTSSALIAGAVENIKNENSPDLFGEKYRTAFQNLKIELDLQRARDALTNELEEIFSVICPSEIFLENESVALFSYKLKNAILIKDMNDAAAVCISDLLEARASGLYSGIFKNKLISRAAEEANKATEQSCTAKFTPIFDGYLASAKKAEAKDRIYSLIFEGADPSDEELLTVEQYFNADGGKIDKCQSDSEIENETERAKARKALRSIKDDFEYTLEIVLGDIDKTSFLSRFTQVLSSAEKELYAIESNDAALKIKANSIVEGSDSSSKEILTEAKAKRFLKDHESIIKKSSEELSVSDELIAKNALVSYTKLEKAVKSALVSQINSIAEKYNIILIKKATAISPNDALYLELCEKIFEEIKSSSKQNIDDFYKTSDLIFQKAVALNEIISEYRLLTAEELYKKFSDEESKSLAKIPQEYAEKLYGVNPLDSATFSDNITDIKDQASRQLHIISQSARIRISTRDSKSAEISSILNEALAKIKLAALKSEMTGIADKAIFKIERILTRDTITAEAEKAKYRIEKMKFIPKETQTAFINEINSLKSNLSGDASIAENITVLTFVWDSFRQGLEKTTSKAEALELEGAVSAYSKELEKAIKDKLSTLDSMKYLDDNIREEIYNEIISSEASFKTEIPNCKVFEDVEKLYQETVKFLSNSILKAESHNLIGYKNELLEGFKIYESIKDNYSVENYNRILELISEASKKLEALSSKAECDKLVEDLKKSIDEIYDLLDDEKAAVLNLLGECFEKCKKNSPLYSSENFAQIESLYEEAKKKLFEFSKLEEIPDVKKLLGEYVALIYGVKKDRIYTCEDAYTISTPSLQYPSGYDISKGLWAGIYLQNGLLGDAELSVNKDSQDALKNAEDAIRKAAKNKKLKFFTPLSTEMQKALRTSAVAMSLDISLSKTAEGASGYILQILMPQELSEEKVLGLAFIDGERVEFYPVQQKDSLILTELEHFSRYYVVIEGTINIKPLLIFLVILLMVEFLVLIGILYLRSKRKQEEQKEISNLPDIPFSAFIPSFPILAKIAPENGILTAILLSIAALALGCTIALLLNSENKTKKRNSQALLPEGQKRLNPKKEYMLLKEGKKDIREDDSFFEEIDSKETFQEDQVLCKVGAKNDSEPIRREINLDVISKNFNSGDTVNLKALKEKGLVPPNTEYVKILASGRLTKSLTVEAQDFSNTAIEMLRLSGGKAIKK